MNIKEIAKKATSLGRIMSERPNKIDTETIIEKYPNGITIDDMELVDLAGEEVCVIGFKEEPESFAFCGMVLKNMCVEVIDFINDNGKDTRVLQSEPIKVKLEKGKTRDGKREITKVTVL